MTEPVFVLVRPQLGENIGAAARAMLNFGLTRMRLVAPRDGWPNPAARAMAAGADEVLDRAEVYDSLADALADRQFVIATTARQRGLFIPVYEPPEAVQVLAREEEGGRATAVLFGGEKSGLATEDVAFADAILTVPVNPRFPSLNLAQAVLLTAYAWSTGRGTGERFGSPLDETPAPREAVEGMIGHLFEALDSTGYFYPESKRPTLERNLRTMLQRARFNEAETRLFRGVVRQLVRGQNRSG